MKRITNIRTLAALLMASAAIVSCSVKEEIFEEETTIKEEPAVQPAEPAKVYTLSVNATKGGDDEATKALSLDGKRLNATWAQNEEVTVFNNTKKVPLDGTLKAQSDGSSTTLKGSLTGTIENGDELILRFNSASYGSQSGTLDYIAANCDFAEASITVSSVDGENNVIPTTSTASFVNQQAIVKFILKDQDNNDLNVSNLTISARSNRLVSASDFRVSKTYYTGYTVDKGSGIAGGIEGYYKLLDGDTGTKWCSNVKSDGVWYVEFHTASAVQVDGYKLTTGNDTQTYPGRNPKNWTLKAKVNSGDAWTVIDTKTDNTDMPAANYSSVDFETDVRGLYQYFRLEVSTVQSGDGLQLSEMQLYGCSSWEFFFRYGNVNVTPASATNELTVALNNQSGASDTYNFTATSGNYDYYFTKSGVTFESGKYYAITVKMAEAVDYKLLSAATAEDIGKVVCADGHLHDARTAILAGCTAVGILGKVTETGCGLILALKDATSQTWDTINGWTSVTTYADTELKVLPDDAARGANLTSYAALGTTAVSDWAVAQQSDYEEIFTNLGSTTNSDGMTYDANVNAYITTGVGGTALDGNYWSATKNNIVDLAYCFGSGIGWGLHPKSVSLSVRPVLGFAPAKLLSAATTSDVGKVVCADGHLRDAKTAVPAGGTAVGILGKVTETGHGLILALQDATAQTGNTIINVWTSTTDFAGGTELKVLPDNAARGSLTSYTTLGTTAVSDWAVAQKSDYQAIFVNLGSTEHDGDGYTYDDNVNAYITGVGGTSLSGYYWSATEIDGNAWCFTKLMCTNIPMTYPLYVRPVLGF